jgi:hypothetical protein
VLRQLAAGEIDLDEAAALLNVAGSGMSVPAGMLAQGGRRSAGPGEDLREDAREDMV